jgi:CheY-like chemotaxis protein
MTDLSRRDADKATSKSALVLVAVIVEDEWLLRAEIADTLADGGWEVLEFENGEGALELLASQPQVDLLVTDIRLGGSATGWDVAEHYRESFANVAVIYCSGNAVVAERQVPRSVFLSKPCAMDALLDVSRKVAKRC